MTQLIFNFKISNTTKKTSFFANFEKKLNLFEQKLSHVSTQLTMKKITIFKIIHSNIVKIQQKFTIYQNKKRKTMFQLKKMYLLTKNLKTKKINKKLNYVKISSFFIKQQKKSINYELNLFSNIKIHSIFYVSLLKSANSKTFIRNTFHFQYEKNDKNEIKTILIHKNQRYFIK